MNSGKRAIFTGLAAGILFAVALFLGVFTQPTTSSLIASAHAGPIVSGMQPRPITTLHGDGAISPAPLSAIAVTQCGLAVSLFIQLDATHLLRADPRQSDMFTAVDGKMVQSQAGPMKWDDAITLAKAAVLSTNVTLPCTEVPSV